MTLIRQQFQAIIYGYLLSYIGGTVIVIAASYRAMQNHHYGWSKINLQQLHSLMSHEGLGGRHCTPNIAYALSFRKAHIIPMSLSDAIWLYKT